MYAEEVTELEYDVPASERPLQCPYCERPFRTEQYRTFHLGRVHPEECTDAERQAFEAQADTEETALFTFHLKAAVSVFLTYFMFTFLYALAWVQ